MSARKRSPAAPIALPGKKGRRFVDKLVRVRLRRGTDAWLLIHVEVERRLRGRKALRLFAWRMHEYRYRIQARLMLQHDLELPPQVYSLGPDKRTRLGPKFELVRALKRYGYDPVVFSQVYRMIEWVITLPKYLEPKFLQAVHALTEESKMTYVTLIEREAIKQTQANTLLRQIERRFGPVSATTTKRIQSAQAPKLETWLLNILDATTLKDVFASAPSSAPHPE